jgi:transcription termination/antitermination protein NusG
MSQVSLSSGTYHSGLLSSLHSAPVAIPTISWYVLKIRTGGELAAIKALRQRGYDPYCPMQKERRSYTDRMKVVDAPVFSGYVFCQLDIQKKLPIVSCPGVDYIIGFGSTPTPVPEIELKNLRRMIDAGAFAIRSMEQGERVRVTHGALEGVEGVLVRDGAGDRLVVSIELLNQGAALHINQDEVCPTGKTSYKAK